MRRIITGLLTATLLASPAAAQDLLNGLFADHAVVQRDRPLPVFGKAKPGEAVTVGFAGNTATATAGADGAWRVDLPATAAGGPYELTAKTATATQTVRDVLAGDIWLCSGQSNMELSVDRANDAWNQVNNGAPDDGVRMVTIEKADSRAPKSNFAKPPAWKPTTKENVGQFSSTLR